MAERAWRFSFSGIRHHPHSQSATGSYVHPRCVRALCWWCGGWHQCGGDDEAVDAGQWTLDNSSAVDATKGAALLLVSLSRQEKSTVAL